MYDDHTLKFKSFRKNVPIPQIAFKFGNIHNEHVYYADVILPSKKKITDIYVVDNEKIFMPLHMKKQWTISEITWENVKNIVSCAFLKEMVKQHSSYYNENVMVTFKKIKINVCKFDVVIGISNKQIKGFTLKEFSNGITKIFLPRYMESWNEKYYTWFEFKKMAIDAYKNTNTYNNSYKALDGDLQKLQNGNNDNVLFEQCQNSQQKNKDKETDEYGRIKNADKSSLVFVPHSVLRPCTISNSNNNYEQNDKKNIPQIINALTKGPIAGGIGILEINILEWIAQLRYATSTMIMDLINGGYISGGWRKTIKQDKLKTIISRLEKYDLISLSFFYAVDDDGNIETNSHSVMRIITLGKNGGVILNELGKNNSKYNAFDTYRDGNTVKRYLSANQWLVYWLKNYPAIKDNYEILSVVSRRGVERRGVKIFSMVNCNNTIMVGEPVRRVEPFEKNLFTEEIKDKLNRFISIFSSMDELYIEKNKFTLPKKIHLPKRPVLVYICEDDLHIDEVYEIIKDTALAYNEQEIWFTTDLRTFNYDVKDSRFIKKDGDNTIFIDILKRLGLSNTTQEINTQPRKSKCALEMKDGHQVCDDIDEFKKYFEPEKIRDYFFSGKLSEWLNDHYYYKSVEAIEKLDKQNPNFLSELCKILGVDNSTIIESQMNCEELADKAYESQDYAISMKNYTLAAELGSIGAMRSIGILYYLGKGVTQDIVQATKWFELAAKFGDVESMNILADM